MVKRFLLLLSGVSLLQDSSAQVSPAFPHLIAYPKVRDCAMSATGSEVWLTIQSPLEELSSIASMRKEGDRWSEPEMMAFSGPWKDMEPFLSPDGLHLYFASDRPVHPDSTSAKDMDIWVVDRQNDQSPWSRPRNLGPPVNTSSDEFYPAVAANGNLYFTKKPEETGRMDDLYLSVWSEEGYADPTPLGSNINTAGYEYNAYIAPDESYLMFGAYNRPDGFGSGDLYIAYLRKDGQWTPAVNLGAEVNGPAMDYCPHVHSATGTLYFTSRRSSLAGKKVETTEQLLNLSRQYENGYSRLYQVPLGSILHPDRP